MDFVPLRSGAALASFMDNPFSPRKPIPSKGDSNCDELYKWVGRSLSMWETTESQFSRLFSHLINPGIGSSAARRAYGSIASSNGRRDLIEKAAAVFFQFFPNEHLQKDMSHVLKLYSDAAARRNDIAHGVVLMGVPKTGDGYYVVANMYTSKRDIVGATPYGYNSQTISEYFTKFDALGGAVSSLVKEIDAHYYASPKTLRERY